MKAEEIRDIAIDSAQVYYNYLDDEKKGTQEVQVIELTYLNRSDMLLKLRLSAKLFNIESIFFRNLKNNKEYSVLEIRVIEYDYDKNIILVKPIESIHEELDDLNKDDIIVISDLKFLIERVRKWYEINGSNINLPIVNSSYVHKADEIEYLTDLRPTLDQQEAIENILNHPFSYIWGAPGTGKTQFVLSYVVLNYINRGDRIAIFAPTNNSIEQVLRGVIQMTDNAGVSRKDIIRLGTPSRKFAEDYPQVCELKGIQHNIDIIDKQIDILERVFKYKKSVDEIEILENCISFFESITTFLAELNTNQTKYNQIVERQIKKEIDIKYINQKLIETEKDENKILKKINSLENKILGILSFGATKHEKKLFEIKTKLIEIKKEIDFENYLLDKIKEDLQASKDIIDTSIMQINCVFSKIKTYVKLAGNEISDTINQISIQNWKKKKEEICLFIDEKQKALSIDKHLKEEYDDQSSNNILCDIEKLKTDRIKIAETSTKERLKSVKVVACTLDGYIGRYYNEKLDVKHIFLDEAGYANIIKAVTLFNHRVPISFLGDHMQLPPVCEIDDSSIINNDKYQNMFLWSQSAIYTESLFSKNRDECLQQYLKNINLSSHYMSKTCLTTTHRFGETLAKVLDKHVYKVNFKSAGGHEETHISFINAPKLTGMKRASILEAEYIKKIVSKLKSAQTDFIILTPYKNQVKLLGINLPEERNALKILTVHGSQGREWDTVILSVVDTADKWFVDSQCLISKGLNLVNTAVSRAKKELIIVCDTEYWKNQNDQLISDLLRSGNEIKL